jgi:hypothetical protein
MGKSLTETAKYILENANAATLKPKSQHADAPETLGSADKIADAPVKVGDGNNVGAAAAVKGEDKSAPKKNAKPAEPAQKLAEAEKVSEETPITEEEDFEITEELAAFIDGLVAEGKTEEEIAEAIAENFELVSEESEKDDDEEDEKEDDKESEDEDEEDKKKDVKEDIQVDMSEHVDALFQGEELSEEFKEKAKTIFEAAVRSVLEVEIVKLEEKFEAALAESIETIKEELSSNVDDYLNYVVEQWVSDNEVAIEAGLRTELTEDFIAGLRNLFAENYIDIPEDKISVVEELGTKVEELEGKLNEEISRNVELTKVITEGKKTEILHTVVEGLTTTQAEKLKSLAENVAYTTADEFANKMKTLRENYFPTTAVKAQGELDQIESGTEGQSMIAEDASNPMNKYVKALGKSLPK